MATWKEISFPFVVRARAAGDDGRGPAPPPRPAESQRIVPPRGVVVDPRQRVEVEVDQARSVRFLGTSDRLVFFRPVPGATERHLAEKGRFGRHIIRPHRNEDARACRKAERFLAKTSSAMTAL